MSSVVDIKIMYTDKKKGINIRLRGIMSSLIIPFFRFFFCGILVIFVFEVRARVIGIQTERATA